jgi:hypothetical protein
VYAAEDIAELSIPALMATAFIVVVVETVIGALYSVLAAVGSEPLVV